MSRAKRQVRGCMAALGLGLAASAHASTTLELRFPAGAETTAQRSEPVTSFRLPVGPFSGGSLPTRLTEGRLDQMAVRVALAQPSTLELLQPLRDQLTGAGFKVLYECETDICGGFDFRYGTDLLPEPDMHVDLGDFRYLAAERQGPEGGEFVSLVVSRSAHDGFVQMTRVGEGGQADPMVTTSTKTPDVAAPRPGRSVPQLAELGDRLELGQAQVLEDLVFEPGTSALAKGSYTSLVALADWLKAKPGRKVTLVGHTDASGSLASNLRLSQLRAENVRQTLLFSHGVAPEQVLAEGVGYLAPRDTNQTEEGRQRNRRVEAIATSTELLAP